MTVILSMCIAFVVSIVLSAIEDCSCKKDR